MDIPYLNKDIFCRFVKILKRISQKIDLKIMLSAIMPLLTFMIFNVLSAKI